MQDQSHLIGERRAAAGSVRGELTLVHLDQVLGLAPGTVEDVVDVLGRAGNEAGNDEADVEAERGGLDAGTDAPRRGPGLGLILRFGIAAQDRRRGERATGADVIGGDVDGTVEYSITGQAENEVDGVFLAEIHDFRPAVMTVATDGDPRVRPVPADTPQKAPQMRGDFLARWRLAGSQNDRDRPAGGGVIDVDRQEAALIIMSVEQRKLLMPVHHVERIVDVQRNRSRRRRIAGAIQIDHDLAQPNNLTQRRCILPARYGRLRAQVCSAVRQSSARNLESRVSTQIIEIVGVLIATRNGENARPQNVRKRVDGSCRIAPIRDRRRQLVGDHQIAFRLSQKHDAAVGTDAAAIKRSADLLLANGWKCEGQSRIVGHGGRGVAVSERRIGFDNRILRCFNQLRHARQPHQITLMN